MTNIAGAELVVIFVLSAVFLIAPIWTLVDAASRPASAFDAIGQSRTTWIILAVVGILVCQIGGAIWGLYYLVRVRPRVAAAVGPTA